MPSSELSTTLILAEIILIETVLIISVSVYFFLKLKKKSLKIKNLFELFLDDEKNRLSNLSLVFKKPEFVDDEKYNEIIKNIINEENLLYKYIINAFYHNDVKLLDSLSTEIQKITIPCAGLLPGNESDKVDNEPAINVDTAIDELLSDEEEELDVNGDGDGDGDPEFDLSEPTEKVSENPIEELIETNVENDEIAEIPSDLLNNTSSINEAETSPENSTEKNNVDNKPSDSKPEE